MPEGALPIQMLLSLSTRQLWRGGSGRLGSPQELTRLPAESTSMIGGARRPPFNSPSSTSCRLRKNTWSWLSTHTPPSPPITHRAGRGLGHNGSTAYWGAPPSARDGAGEKIPTAAMAITAQVPALIRSLVVMYVLSSYRRSESYVFLERRANPTPVKRRRFAG